MLLSKVKTFLIAVTIICVTIMIIQFSMIAEAITTSIELSNPYGMAAVNIIEGRDMVVVNAKGIVKTISDGVYHVRIEISAKDYYKGDRDFNGRSISDIYLVKDLELEYNLDDSERVVFCSAGDGTKVLGTGSGIIAVADEDSIAVDLIITGEAPILHELKLRYDIFGIGLFYMNRFEDVEVTIDIPIERCHIGPIENA